jgi:hypothetical protein
VQKKESKEKRPPLVHNCLRQSRLPSLHKTIREEKKELSLRQFFFVSQINFILFGGTQREEGNQDQSQKYANKQSNRLTICCSKDVLCPETIVNFVSRQRALLENVLVCRYR